MLFLESLVNDTERDPCHRSDWGSDSVAHWTVRGFCNGRAKMTLHVYPDGRQAQFWPNGGKRWRRKVLHVYRECYRLQQFEGVSLW